MILVLSCSCLCQVLTRELRWSWSSSDRQCFTWVTTSEWSTSWLPTKVWLILEVWQHIPPGLDNDSSHWPHRGSLKKKFDKYKSFKWHGWGTYCEIALRWMSLDLNDRDDKSTLVQIMAWCRQATHHYLNQCWPMYVVLRCVIRPQWVKRHMVQ